MTRIRNEDEKQGSAYETPLVDYSGILMGYNTQLWDGWTYSCVNMLAYGSDRKGTTHALRRDVKAVGSTSSTAGPTTVPSKTSVGQSISSLSTTNASISNDRYYTDVAVGIIAVAVVVAVGIPTNGPRRG